MVVHIGVAIVAVALAVSSSYLRQTEFRFSDIGDSATFAGHELVFQGNEVIEKQEKIETVVRVTIDGKVFTPAISIFPFSGQPIGTPSTRSTWKDDVQLSVLKVPETQDEPTVVRVTVQPLVWWLWVGGAVMAAGTIMASIPPRRKNKTEIHEEIEKVNS